VADTIFALSTARGRAGLAVIRLSGPDADAALAALGAAPLPPFRRLSLRPLRDPAVAETLDEALVVRFAPGASFTGEASAELHLHGGVASVAAVLAALGRLPGLRPAGPGEFARRALDAGRLDLTRAEALADLIDAETEAQRRQALRQMQGALAEAAAGWRARLVAARALLEAAIDFADEDLPGSLAAEGAAALAALAADLRATLAASRGAERLRDGFEVAVVGAPNAGKSSLVNAIAGRDVALTSPVPGTTRDVLEVRCDLAGLPVTFLDMAGLRDTDDPVEAAGVARARARAAAADLRLFLRPDDADPPPLPLAPGDLTVRSKADLGAPGGGLAVSALTGAGLDALLAAVAAALRDRVPADGLVTRERQRAALADAASALDAAAGAPVEIAADAARAAARRLDALIGAVDVEDVLDRLFASFCIGK
jgi:tRNA modification GTPase